MPSKLYKVQKHVAKKKGHKLDALHENSRDAKRLRNAGARDEKVTRTTSLREKANLPWLNRVSFLRDNLPDTLHPLEMDEIQPLIKQFLARFDEELATLKAERRPGRPPTTRQTLLEQHIKSEGQEYSSGFWVPNLQDEQTIERLDSWNGDWSSLANLRFVRVSESGHVKESQFPPRGAS